MDMSKAVQIIMARFQSFREEMDSGRSDPELCLVPSIHSGEVDEWTEVSDFLEGQYPGVTHLREEEGGLRFLMGRAYGACSTFDGPGVLLSKEEVEFLL